MATTPDFDNKREDANMEIGKYSNDYPARGSFACRITFAKKSRIIDSQRQPSPPDTVFENYRKSLSLHC